MKCRGVAVRQEIVKNFQLRPIAHVKLLAGQMKRSCINDALTDSYYCFSYEGRGDSNFGSFFCGQHAASHFLTLLGEKQLPMFNALKAGDSDVPESSMHGGMKRKILKWDAAAKQLYNALNLLVVCWDAPPGPALANIKQRLEQSRDLSPHPSQVKAVNTIISKDFRKRTLREMIDELAVKNDIKSYNFDLLNEILYKIEVASNYG